MLLRVGDLPEEALAASVEFHARVLPGVLRVLAEQPAELTLVFAPADYTHRGWRLAAVQQLARENAPVRVNALASDDELAIAAAHAYLGRAEGVTGQLLPLDGAGAGEVVTGNI
jgi:hypothetical protein